MIKYNSSNINGWYFDESNIIKVYRNGAVVYYKITSGETPSFDVCYAVVDDITQYIDREFEDVYDKATEKWYKLNNLNQYEEYGVYGSGRNVTTYDGKLTIDDGYEYQYSGGSWVNVGEVSGSTATLPNVPFTVNYNAKNYDSSTKTLLKTEGQLANVDAVVTAGTPTVSDGYLTIASGTRATISGYQTYFNRTNTNGSRALTIVSKQRTDGNNGHMFANRDSNYNWMYRCYSTKLTLHGTSETGSIAVTTQPVIESVRVQDSSPMIVYNNYTNNTTSSTSSFSYGGTNSGNFALFQGYATTTGENFVGDFYWVYMSQNTLTDEQVQQVIAYNEGGGGQPIYPIYYDEKADPLNGLTFNTMEDALDYAYNNCVYDGMRATIAGERYYFDSEDENGWVKILAYYKVEDVSPDGTSGWTITGSSTYNPNLSYYDDFSVENNTTTNKTKIAKVTIYGYDSFTYYLRSTGRTSYAYATSTNIDTMQSDPTGYIPYNGGYAITNTYQWNKTAGSAVNLSNYRRVTYNNLDKTVEHTFYVSFYGRTYSSYYANATLLIPKIQDEERWEQVTFSASSNVASVQKSLYIDGNNSTSGGTSYWYYRWIIGLPAGSHNSYVNYSNYDYCPNVTSSTFTSVAGEQRQVNFTYDSTTNKSLTCRLVDTSGNTLTPTNTVYYQFNRRNSCNVQSNMVFSFATSTYSVWFKTGGRFSLNNATSYPNMYHIYGYTPPTLGTTYYVDNYSSTFDIVYTALTREVVTITYTTYDPNDSETPTFSTEITWPYSGGSKVTTAGTSYDVPYTYSYTVKQTSNMFYTSGNQTYTAGQASRTITFTLYPNNREFASVADLEAYGYTWEGMIAYVGTDKYVYQNGEWVYNPSRLPAGYTEVEYVQNTGTSYFNTNFVPNQDTRVVCDMQNVTASNYPRLWGAGAWNSATGLLIDYDPNTFQVSWLGNTSWTNYSAYPTSTSYNRHTYDLNKNYMYIDEVLVGSNTYTTRTASDPIGVFTYIGSGRPSSSTYWGREHFKGKMYSFKVYNNGTLVRDLVPCIRDNDNTVGAYDIVNDVFYTVPSGYTTDTLVAGNPV